MENIDLGTLSEKNLKRYIATLYHLISKKKISFDLIIGAGDSGAAMAKIAELTFQRLDIKIPVIIYVPIYRHEDEAETKLFDNSIFAEDIQDKVNKINKLTNILFVDDEIEKAVVASESLKLVLKAIDKSKVSKEILFVITAEDHGFKWNYNFENVKVEFYPFSKKIEGYYSIISCVIPWEIENPIKEHFPDEIISPKQRMNILLGLPVKRFTGNKPVFTFKYTDRVKRRVSNLEELEEEFKSFLNKVIDQAIKEYKEYKIIL